MNTLPRQENDFWQRSNQSIPEQLPTLTANEFLPRIGRWTSIGGTVVFTIFVSAAVLTSILKYKVTVKVPATIRPVGELKLVQSLIGGKVVKIDVTENQAVNQNQAIAYLDDFRLQNQKSQLQKTIQQSQLQLNNIDVQLQEVNTQITAQINLNDRTAVATQAQLLGTQRNYLDQRIKAAADMLQAESALTLARIQKDRLQREQLLKTSVAEAQVALDLAKAQQTRLQKEQLLRKTVEEAESALTVAKQQRDRLQQEKFLTATVQEAQAALNLAQVQQERLQPIVASGAISRNFFEEKEQAVKSAAAKLEQAKVDAKNLLEDKQQAVIAAEAKLAQAKANAKNLLEEKQQAVTSAEAKLAQANANANNLQDEKDQALIVAQTNLQKAKTAINPSDANVTVASAQIQQEQAKGQATLAALQKEKQNLLQQRLEFQTQLDRTRKQLQQTENDLNQSIVRAPITGTVIQLNLRNPGQVVQPSEAIAQIAPANTPIQIKANVPAQDISKVKSGQQVQMQVSACPYPDYGTLKGIVKTVSPDALPIAQNSPQTNTPQPTAYEVIIQPQTPYVGRGDRQCPLQAGMEGKADIISRQETVLHFILRKARLIADL